MTPADLIALLTQTAPALRAAGVQSLTTPDFSLKLSPPDPPPVPRQTKREREAAEAASSSDPLDDPMTYPGGYVPRYPDEDAPAPRQRKRAAPKDEHDDD